MVIIDCRDSKMGEGGGVEKWLDSGSAPKVRPAGFVGSPLERGRQPPTPSYPLTPYPTESFTEEGAGLGDHVRRFPLLDASFLGLGLGLEPGMVTPSSR